MTAMSYTVTLAKRFEKSDILYLVVISAFTFLLLSQVSGITVKSYTTLAAAGVRFESVLLPVALGTVFAAILYLLLRLRFSQLNSFIVVLLIATSIAFTDAFAAGSFSAPVALLYGHVSLPIEFTLERIRELTFVLPLAVLGAVYFALRRNPVGAAFSLFAIFISFGTPIVALPLLAAAGAFGLELLERPSKEHDTVFAFVACASMALYLMGQPTVQSAAFAVFAGALMAAVLFIAENRHKLNAVILLSLLFISLLNGFASVHVIDRIDAETLAAIGQLRAADGRIGIASIYAAQAPAIVKYETGRDAEFGRAVEFMFSAVPASDSGLDYILLDTRVIDNAAGYAALANRTARFETFAFSRLAQSEGNYFAVYLSKSSVLAIPVNERGAVISDTAFLNGERVSLYKFVRLETDDPRYSRYVYPKGDTNLNILKLLFPEQFGAVEGAEEVWISNTSRMRLYRITS